MRKIEVSKIIEIVFILAGITGGVVGIGDRLYFSKTDGVAVRQEVREVHKKVDFMYQAFWDAAKQAHVDKMGGP